MKMNNITNAYTNNNNNNNTSIMNTLHNNTNSNNGNVINHGSNTLNKNISSSTSLSYQINFLHKDYNNNNTDSQTKKPNDIVYFDIQNQQHQQHQQPQHQQQQQQQQYPSLTLSSPTATSTVTTIKYQHYLNPISPQHVINLNTPPSSSAANGAGGGGGFGIGSNNQMISHAEIQYAWDDSPKKHMQKRLRELHRITPMHILNKNIDLGLGPIPKQKNKLIIDESVKRLDINKISHNYPQPTHYIHYNHYGYNAHTHANGNANNNNNGVTEKKKRYMSLQNILQGVKLQNDLIPIKERKVKSPDKQQQQQQQQQQQNHPVEDNKKIGTANPTSKNIRNRFYLNQFNNTYYNTNNQTTPSNSQTTLSSNNSNQHKSAKTTTTGVHNSKHYIMFKAKINNFKKDTTKLTMSAYLISNNITPKAIQQQQQQQQQHQHQGYQSNQLIQQHCQQSQQQNQQTQPVQQQQQQQQQKFLFSTSTNTNTNSNQNEKTLSSPKKIDLSLSSLREGNLEYMFDCNNNSPYKLLPNNEHKSPSMKTLSVNTPDMKFRNSKSIFTKYNSTSTNNINYSNNNTNTINTINTNNNTLSTNTINTQSDIFTYKLLTNSLTNTNANTSPCKIDGYRNRFNDRQPNQKQQQQQQKQKQQQQQHQQQRQEYQQRQEQQQQNNNVDSINIDKESSTIMKTEDSSPVKICESMGKQAKSKTEGFVGLDDSIELETDIAWAMLPPKNPLFDPPTLKGDSVIENKGANTKFEAKKKFVYIRRKLRYCLFYFKLLKLNINEVIENPNIFSKKPYEKQGSYQFIQATKKGNYEAVMNLMGEYSKYLVYDFDHLYRTALHLACKKGYLNIVKALIDHGADVNAIDLIGRTPLYFAIKYQKVDVVRYLFYSRCDPWSVEGINYKELCKNNRDIKHSLTKARKLDILMRMIKAPDRESFWEVEKKFLLEDDKYHY